MIFKDVYINFVCNHFTRMESKPQKFWPEYLHFGGNGLFSSEAVQLTGTRSRTIFKIGISPITPFLGHYRTWDFGNLGRHAFEAGSGAFYFWDCNYNWGFLFLGFIVSGAV